MSWRDRIANAILGGKVGGPTPSGIHVYHSSPHDFDKFDLGKIGTGEGAQVYGHGIYAAENPAVSGRGGQYWQQFAPRFAKDNPEGRALDYLKHYGMDRPKAAGAIEDELAWHEYNAKNALDPQAAAKNSKLFTDMQRARELLQSGAPVGPRTYEVNFRAKPEELLDWDKPLSAQAPGTREALAKLGVPDAPHVKGEQAYWHLKGDMLQRYGHRDPNLNAAYTSQVLNEAGIPGIRYLDEGSRNIPQQRLSLEKDIAKSRAAGDQQLLNHYEGFLSRLPQPTHNYVAFDPSKLDIMAKYGVVGGVPLGALAATDQYGAQP